MMSPLLFTFESIANAVLAPYLFVAYPYLAYMFATNTDNSGDLRKKLSKFSGERVLSITFNIFKDELRGYSTDHALVKHVYSFVSKEISAFKKLLGQT